MNKAQSNSFGFLLPVTLCMFYFSKKRVAPLLLISVVMLACTNQPRNKKPEQTITDTTTAPSPIIMAGADTLVVTRKAAVFYEPDSMQIEKRKQAVGEDDFYTGVEDYAYYLNAAHDFLADTKLPIMEAKSKKVMEFIGNKQTKQFIKMDTLSDLWGIYFFDPAKGNAKQVDMTMIEEEYKAYFK